MFVYQQHFSQVNSMCEDHAHGRTLGIRMAEHWPHCRQAAANKNKTYPCKILNNKFWCNRDAAKNNIQNHHEFPIMFQLSKP